MVSSASIFLEFNLPNATTWFYFSMLLAVALFFKFSRLLSMRNWDVLTLPLLVPGLLLLRESHGNNWFGYLWLFAGSAYVLFRCLFDLALVTRPVLSPNMNLGGLAWLAGTLSVCLFAVAARQEPEVSEPDSSKPAPINEIEHRGEQLALQQAEAIRTPDLDVSIWVSRALALGCHLAVALGLIFVGGWHFQDWHAGMAAATFYLLLPYTALDISKWHHVWPMALMVWAVVVYRRPTLAGLLLGLAAATMYFPVVTFPAWLGFYWRRGAGRFAAAFCLVAGLCLAVIGSLLWVNAELLSTFLRAVTLPDWQPWRAPKGTQGFWENIHWAYRMPLFILHLSLVMVTAFWPAPKNLAQLLALSAAVIVGIQFWYSDRGGIYILWYLPFVLLLVFRPNLAERRPLPIQPETDWLSRLGRGCSRLLHRLLVGPEPVARVK